MHAIICYSFSFPSFLLLLSRQTVPYSSLNISRFQIDIKSLANWIGLPSGLSASCLPSTGLLHRFPEAFSTVSMRAKASSKSSPQTNRPWWAQTTTRYFSISLTEASAISPCRPAPSTAPRRCLQEDDRIFGRHLPGSSRVNALSSSGSTKDAIGFVG